MITDKSNSGTLTTSGRSGGERDSGQFEHNSANSSGSSEGCNYEVTDNINDSSGTGMSKNTLPMIIYYRGFA